MKTRDENYAENYYGNCDENSGCKLLRKLWMNTMMKTIMQTRDDNYDENCAENFDEN